MRPTDDAGPARGRRPGKHTPALSAQDWDRVRRLLADLRREGRAYRYPWNSLEDDLAGAEGPLTLFGYGSLMNAASAAETVVATTGRAGPALAFGVVRVFNYVIPEGAARKYGPIDDPAARAALNVYPTDEADDVVNGVLIRVPAADLPALREREGGYDLVPVPCLDWFHPSSAPITAFALSCPDGPVGGAGRIDDSLKPHVGYLEKCLQGAASVSDEFRAMFLESTYLGGLRKRLNE